MTTLFLNVPSIYYQLLFFAFLRSRRENDRRIRTRSHHLDDIFETKREIRNSSGAIAIIWVEWNLYSGLIWIKFKGKRGRRWEKGKKRRENGRKEGNSSKKERKYTYFVSLFNIGPYDRPKSPQKTGKNFKKFQGGNFFFWVSIIYTPVVFRDNF